MLFRHGILYGRLPPYVLCITTREIICSRRCLVVHKSWSLKRIVESLLLSFHLDLELEAPEKTRSLEVDTTVTLFLLACWLVVPPKSNTFLNSDLTKLNDKPNSDPYEQSVSKVHLFVICVFSIPDVRKCKIFFGKQ